MEGIRRRRRCHAVVATCDHKSGLRKHGGQPLGRARAPPLRRAPCHEQLLLPPGRLPSGGARPHRPRPRICRDRDHRSHDARRHRPGARGREGGRHPAHRRGHAHIRRWPRPRGMGGKPGRLLKPLPPPLNRLRRDSGGERAGAARWHSGCQRDRGRRERSRPGQLPALARFCCGPCGRPAGRRAAGGRGWRLAAAGGVARGVWGASLRAGGGGARGG